MRIGWMYAPQEILKQFNIAKQAADLHSNFFCQKILHRYLMTCDLDAHIRKVVSVYRKNCQHMCDLLDDLLPMLAHTHPEGGMFLLATLPPGISSRQVFDEGIKQKVAVLPGFPFYVDGGGDRYNPHELFCYLRRADQRRYTPPCPGHHISPIETQTML